MCYLDLFGGSLLPSFMDRVGAFMLLGAFS
jgi:hypothetical protein